MRTVGHTRRGAVESRTKGVDAMSDRIDIAMLHRPGSRGKSERHSVDFLVNGRSLFVATRAAQHDLCGCFSPDYAKSANELAHHENERLAKLFLFESPLQIASDRVALFVCPERSDPACGAITIQLNSGDVVRRCCGRILPRRTVMTTREATPSLTPPFGHLSSPWGHIWKTSRERRRLELKGVS
jgi:hypothetical protein